ncbi:hypothetical protein KP509_1Z230000 [Ceratopteris richardii]|nr:hypothetical protein KP509_1Z230000 [Ceratopteris richardii]KAH6555759.1 hypothetical protein KP509_1Z230000 [Ceratopteris richardii]KAH6555760.1 hypothetical protein KP509_1Z230000 [Ceratopteris richardii]KAH6555761.1 hypothetical protein KP509_1Z230000 [Ceratopteris richardii]
MYKNQLQELAQRSCFNLPAYSCIREGPDHAPRFKANVNFNGEIFESPQFCTTLRQAEHAAAEVALNTLSKRGPSQSLAAKILDETSVCKNLLQETAQRLGVALPVYTIIKPEPGHLPVFKCLVEVAGRVFAGEPAKTKKQAEKNAAMVAWSAMKQWTQSPAAATAENGSCIDSDGNSNALVLHKMDNSSSQTQLPHRRHGGRSKMRVVNVRGKNRFGRESSPSSGHFQYGSSSSPSSPSGELGLEERRFLFGAQVTTGCSMENPRSMGSYQRSTSLFDGESAAVVQQDVLMKSRVGGSGGGSIAHALPLPWHPKTQLQQQKRPSRLSFQSRSDRFELRRPLMEEFELLHKDVDNDWLNAGFGAESLTSFSHAQQCQHYPQGGKSSERIPSGVQKRVMFQSQSERFELKPSLVDELYYNDEEDYWWRGELTQPVAMLERARSALGAEQQSSCIPYYDGSRVSPSSTQNSTSHVSNDLGRIASALTSGYIDTINKPISGFDEVGGPEASNDLYADCYSFQSPFPCFQTPSSSSSSILFEEMERECTYSENIYHGDRISSYLSSSYDREQGSDSYTSLTSAEGPSHFYFNSEGSRNSFSGYLTSSRNRQQLENELGTGSSVTWPHAADIWVSGSGESQFLGLRNVKSTAPSVRVHQKIAVCSAAPPRCPARETTVPTNPYLKNENPHPVILQSDPSSSSEASACQLFRQLRI